MFVARSLHPPHRVVAQRYCKRVLNSQNQWVIQQPSRNKSMDFIVKIWTTRQKYLLPGRTRSSGAGQPQHLAATKNRPFLQRNLTSSLRRLQKKRHSTPASTVRQDGHRIVDHAPDNTAHVDPLSSEPAVVHSASDGVTAPHSVGDASPRQRERRSRRKRNSLRFEQTTVVKRAKKKRATVGDEEHAGNRHRVREVFSRLWSGSRSTSGRAPELPSSELSVGRTRPPSKNRDSSSLLSVLSKDTPFKYDGGSAPQATRGRNASSAAAPPSSSLAAIIVPGERSPNSPEAGVTPPATGDTHAVADSHDAEHQHRSATSANASSSRRRDSDPEACAFCGKFPEEAAILQQVQAHIADFTEKEAASTLRNMYPEDVGTSFSQDAENVSEPDSQAESTPDPEADQTASHALYDSLLKEIFPSSNRRHTDPFQARILWNQFSGLHNLADTDDAVEHDSVQFAWNQPKVQDAATVKPDIPVAPQTIDHLPVELHDIFGIEH